MDHKEEDVPCSTYIVKDFQQLLLTITKIKQLDCDFVVQYEGYSISSNLTRIHNTNCMIDKIIRHIGLLIADGRCVGVEFENNGIFALQYVKSLNVLEVKASELTPMADHFFLYPFPIKTGRKILIPANIRVKMDVKSIPEVFSGVQN
jgi:hypothetical protein